MTRTIMFVQGGGEGAYEIDALLAESLRSALGAGYDVQYPRMPKEDSPDDRAWNAKLTEAIAALADRPIVVAHSVGAAIVLRGLAQGAENIAALFLVAPPFVGKGGWSIPGSEPMADIGAKLPADLPIHIYHGRADETVTFAHQALYGKAIPQAQFHAIDDADHQFNNDLSAVAADIRRLDQGKHAR